MGGPGISRLYNTRKSTIPNGAAKPTTGIDARQAAGALVRVPGVWTAADIGFEVAGYDALAEGGEEEGHRLDQTYHPLFDKTGARVKITGVVINGWFEVPAQVLMAGYFRPVSLNTAGGADLNQAGDRVLVFAFKT